MDDKIDETIEQKDPHEANIILEKASKQWDSAKRAIEILEEALSGTSPLSKNELIRTAIRVLKC